MLFRSETLSQDSAQPSPAPAAPHCEAPFGGLSERQVALLSAPLDRGKVRQRDQGRTAVSYLEGWQVISEANRIFGFDGWQRQTIAMRCIPDQERPIGERRFHARTFDDKGAERPIEQHNPHEDEQHVTRLRHEDAPERRPSRTPYEARVTFGASTPSAGLRGIVWSLTALRRDL